MSSNNLGKPTRTASAENLQVSLKFGAVLFFTEGVWLHFSTESFIFTEPVITNTTPINTESKPITNRTVLLQIEMSSSRPFWRWGAIVVVIRVFRYGMTACFVVSKARHVTSTEVTLWLTRSCQLMLTVCRKVNMWTKEDTLHEV